MKQFFAALIFVSALSVALAAPPVLAQAEFAQAAQTEDDWEIFVQLAQNKKLTESEAAKRAQQQYGGKVVSVVCREQDDRVYCSVRLDIDGRIKTVTIRG